MSFKIVCPKPECGASYDVDDEDVGGVNCCKLCKEEFAIDPRSREDGQPSSAGFKKSAKTAEPELPESFGRYKVISVLGRGSMGTVYLANDVQLDRQVALKVPKLDDLERRPEIRFRFLREGRAAARFHHPNFCPIHDIGEVDGVPYLTMAYIQGQTLLDTISYGEGWPIRRAAEVVRTLALALAELHRQGIIHRDLKPANVMIDARGVPVVMDFGLARSFANADPAFTSTGAILGTPSYMSPEQAEGNHLAMDHRSDLYSLGVILYELLTGRLPFEGSVMRILRMIVYVAPPPPSTHRPDLDPGLEKICLRALAKRPDDRYSSMEAFAKVLQTWLDTRRPGPDPAQVKLISESCSLVPLRVTNSLDIEFRLIPAGEFEMGSDDSDKDAQNDEKPRHRVRISRPFYLATTEVTIGQFRKFVEDANYRTEGERDGKGGFGWDEAWSTFTQDPKHTWRTPGFPQEDDHPVVNVSWNDAVEFCAWLSRKETLTYRLPTEAEWEYACRAKTTTKYWVGDESEALATAANIADGTAREMFPHWPTITSKDGYVFTAPVGRFRPNAWDLFDMHGNVWEWCSDWYDSGYYSRLISPAQDPRGPTVPTTSRVIRGGAWNDAPRNVRSANRSGNTPSYRDFLLGFRVARVE